MMNDQTIAWLLEKDNPRCAISRCAICWITRKTTARYKPRAARSCGARQWQKILGRAKARGILGQAGFWLLAQVSVHFVANPVSRRIGADGRNKQVRRGVEYYLEHAQATHGGFSASASVARVTPCNASTAT